MKTSVNAAARIMTYVSLSANVIVLVPVCVLLCVSLFTKSSQSKDTSFQTENNALQPQDTTFQTVSNASQTVGNASQTTDKITDQAWGADGPARRILTAVYLSILLVSVALLFKPVPTAVLVLLLVQILYKVAAPFLVGTVSNPVVITNMVVAAVHIATCVLLVLSFQAART
jgi:hypothetical protein